MDNAKQVQLFVVSDQRIREKRFFSLMIYFLICIRGANHSDAQHYQCCSGFYIDIFNILKDRLKFEFELYQVLDKTWGARNAQTVIIYFVC